MWAKLEYGQKYRATVAIGPAVKLIITDEMIGRELTKWQLFGQVTDIPTGYQLEGEFRGKTGTYHLPPEVESIEILG